MGNGKKKRQYNKGSRKNGGEKTPRGTSVRRGTAVNQTPSLDHRGRGGECQGNPAGVDCSAERWENGRFSKGTYSRKNKTNGGQTSGPERHHKQRRSPEQGTEKPVRGRAGGPSQSLRNVGGARRKGTRVKPARENEGTFNTDGKHPQPPSAGTP